MKNVYRRGRDSNPRDGYPPTAFRMRLLQPLGHLSKSSAVGCRLRRSINTRQCTSLRRALQLEMLLLDCDLYLRFEIHPLEHLGLVLFFVADQFGRRCKDDQDVAVVESDAAGHASRRGWIRKRPGDRHRLPGLLESSIEPIASGVVLIASGLRDPSASESWSACRRRRSRRPFRTCRTRSPSRHRRRWRARKWLRLSGWH